MPQLAGQLDLEQAARWSPWRARRTSISVPACSARRRDKFQEFVKKFEGKPEATQARLELAKLVAYHGQALLTKALREEEVKEQHEAARHGGGRSSSRRARSWTWSSSSSRTRSRSRRSFDRGVNYIDQARTYIDLSKDANNYASAPSWSTRPRRSSWTWPSDENSEVGLLANAWLVKCYQELQDPTESLKYLQARHGAAGKAAEPAQRLARYFYIQWIPNDPALMQEVKGIDKIKLDPDRGEQVARGLQGTGRPARPGKARASASSWPTPT